MDYIEKLNDIVDFLVEELYPTSWTIGRAEPQPEDYPYIKVDYPEKTDEVGKFYATGYQTHIDLIVPIVMCANENTIELSKAKCWEVIEDVEEAIRGDIQLDSMTDLSRGVPREARGEFHSGNEFRLTLNLDCRFQIHKEA